MKEHPSVLCPLGDFFGLGNEIVNSYDSMLFSASTARNNEFNTGCSLNSYVQMPFNRSARIELTNEGDTPHRQYFYIGFTSSTLILMPMMSPIFTPNSIAKTRAMDGDMKSGSIHQKPISSTQSDSLMTPITSSSPLKGEGHYIGV